MTRKLQPLEYVAAAVEKDCRKYSLGDVVREIADLTILQVVNGLDRNEESKRIAKTIEGRLDKLYAELDDREKSYNYREKPRC
ncbi:MAG: hypothetical protein AABX31_00305 [Nanoarchaeota archaeon]